MQTLSLQIPEGGPDKVAVGLLVPIPPDTAHQRRTNVTQPTVASLRRVKALNAEQEAFFLPGLDGAGARFAFGLENGSGASPAAHWQPLHSRYSTPSAELRDHIVAMVKDAPNRQAAVDTLVDFTASLFDYDHPKARFCDGKDEVPLLLTLTKGSCTDINTFLLSSLYAAAIPATYYAGYFFENGKPRQTSGFHCWISTLAEERHLDWDIAHHIKNGSREVKPGLNPVPGERVALSYARGLRFEVDGTEVEFTHFAYPYWVFADGSYQPAAAIAMLA
ncbi:MAG: transglutaminase family protein [Rhodospirillaceae bacterium]|nr:transglutaminase family protein [Rhodospirillales bacterium]